MKKRFGRKMMAMTLAGTMVLTPTTVFADTGESSGTAKIEGLVNKDVFVVELPTANEGAFNFILDPQGLIKATSQAAYAGDENTTITFTSKGDDAGLYFPKVTTQAAQEAEYEEKAIAEIKTGDVVYAVSGTTDAPTYTELEAVKGNIDEIKANIVNYKKDAEGETGAQESDVTEGTVLYTTAYEEVTVTADNRMEIIEAVSNYAKDAEGTTAAQTSDVTEGAVLYKQTWAPVTVTEGNLDSEKTYAVQTQEEVAAKTTTVYDADSVALTAKNLGTLQADVTLTATLTTDLTLGELDATTEAFKDTTKPSVYLALESEKSGVANSAKSEAVTQTDDGNVAKITDTLSPVAATFTYDTVDPDDATKTVNVTEDVYNINYNAAEETTDAEGNKKTIPASYSYELNPKTEGNYDFPSITFNLTGKCNKAATWESSKTTSSIAVTWKLEKHSDDKDPSVGTGKVMEQNKDAVISVDLGSGEKAATGIKAVTWSGTNFLGDTITWDATAKTLTVDKGSVNYFLSGSASTTDLVITFSNDKQETVKLEAKE